MAYSERFPKQKVVRRKKVVLPTDRHRNTTDKKFFLPPRRK